MFGYICINEDELKMKDWKRYRGFYCGVCNGLRKRSGNGCRVLLNYDMTFLSILLNGLYEPKETSRQFRCPLHPMKKQTMICSEATDYCSDMTVLLSFHQLMDGFFDDRNFGKGGFAMLIRKKYRNLAITYPRQTQAVECYVKKLSEAEQSHNSDLDYVANLTGTMLGEIFAWKEDRWSESLRDLGFYFGKFIYLMDAYEDLEKDRKKHQYNILLEKNMSDEDLEIYCHDLFPMIISEGVKIFERMPIIKDAEILRNIMYAGIWCKYVMIRQKRRERKEKDYESSL